MLAWVWPIEIKPYPGTEVRTCQIWNPAMVAVAPSRLGLISCTARLYTGLLHVPCHSDQRCARLCR
ncbi:uncharacterized protein LAESUDRAFT_732965 [Laetiporus sulphureus 93-53]|uniref:Uncharacterized protein n=1 Tax=Laetiporus sulphureus 93-53 TaxID=1314785 RepID=A0A165AUH1_9APHY|nr:uncharacterized protein LAESUDRAFT_732965 [Laetiporus sulphureus 93-53]KZS99685.1 hypothetical protein LAESUDRAFT_732965 [Laetiporus sulphureus 93-53]